MLLELAAVILQPLGYGVKTFRDPAAALRAFTASEPKPVLLITDYAMHAMTGLDLLKGCRRIQPRQKALMVSGTVDETTYSNSPCKPDRFLATPYQSKQLLAAVKSLLA